VDRRGFLKALGIGGGLVVAAPQAVLAATTRLALPERKVFLPPVQGWPTWAEGESALSYARRIPGTDDWYVDTANGVALDYGQSFRGQTTYDVETYEAIPFHVAPGDTLEVTMHGYSGFMVVEDIEYWTPPLDAGKTRLRGLGVESYYGYGDAKKAVGSLTVNRGSVTRSLREMGPPRLYQVPR
jgi:hypothetical protein